MTSRRTRLIAAFVLALMSVAATPVLAAEAPAGQMTWALHFTPGADPLRARRDAGPHHALHGPLRAPRRPREADARARAMAPEPGRVVEHVARRARLRVRAAQGVDVPQRRARHGRGRQVLVRAVPRHLGEGAQGAGWPRSRLRIPAASGSGSSSRGRTSWPSTARRPPAPAGSSPGSTSRRWARTASRRRRSAPARTGSSRSRRASSWCSKPSSGYWRKTPSVKRLVFKVGPRRGHAAGHAQARRGGHRLRGQRRARRGGAAHAGLTLRPTPFVSTHWLRLRRPVGSEARRGTTGACASPPTYAVDRQAINQAVTLGFSKITGSIIPTSFDFYWQPPLYPYDPARARQLLAEAGLPEGLRRRRLLVRRRGLPATASRCSTTCRPSGIKAQASPARAGGVPQGVSGEEAEEHHLRPQRRLRQRRHPARAVRGLGRRLRLRGLSRHRRALPGAGGRARPRRSARRSSTASSSSIHEKAMFAADLAARAPAGGRPARGGVGARAHRRLSVVGAVRGPEAQGEVTRAARSPAGGERGYFAGGATETPRAPVFSIARATSPDALASSTTRRR